MLEIRILITDLDYDGIVDVAVPLVANGLIKKGGLVGRLAVHKEKLADYAHKLLAKKDPSQRDAMVAELATKKRSLLLEKASSILEKKQIHAQICDISVKKISDEKFTNQQ